MPWPLLLTICATVVVFRPGVDRARRMLRVPLVAGVLVTGGVMGYGYFATALHERVRPGPRAGRHGRHRALVHWRRSPPHLAGGPVFAALAAVVTVFGVARQHADRLTRRGVPPAAVPARAVPRRSSTGSAPTSQAALRHRLGRPAVRAGRPTTSGSAATARRCTSTPATTLRAWWQLRPATGHGGRGAWSPRTPRPGWCGWSSSNGASPTSACG